MKKIMLFTFLFVASFSSYATVTAVINTNGSSTGLSYLKTCSGTETPTLRVTLWENGNIITMPPLEVIQIQWLKYDNGLKKFIVLKDWTNLGMNDGLASPFGDFKINLHDEGISFQWDTWTEQTSNIHRTSGLFMAQIRDNSRTFPTNSIDIVEGNAPAVKINDLYSLKNVYTVLSGCDSGNVMLKVHPSQTCAVDQFTLSMWEVDGFGNDIGSHYWRPLTSTEIASVSGTGATGINIKSLNSNVSGGSGNGTINMIAGRHYAVEFKYTGQWTNQPTYLTIYYKQGNWDVVMTDKFTTDVQFDGYEPVDKWNNDVFRSPYLWNKLSTSANPTDGVHENPDYSTIYTSKIMYKVTNIGCAQSVAGTAGGATLRLFWTRARIGDEPWGSVWKYDLVNNAFGSRPGGSEITIAGPSFGTPYNSTSFPINLPAINPGATYTVSFANAATWYPPDPAWYDPSTGPMSTDNTWPVICLLARINEPGSTNDKLIYEPTGTMDKILPYVKNNNNVATRNTYLVNTPQHVPVGGGSSWHHDWGSVAVSNPSITNPKNVNICVDLLPDPGVSGTFLNHGTIRLATTDNLHNYWALGGSSVTGIIRNAVSNFTLTNGSRACLNNVILPAGAKEQLGLRFEFNAASLPAVAKNFSYQVSLIQLDDIGGGIIDTVYGSNVIYMVNVPTSSPVQPGGFTTGNASVENVLDFAVFPNPAMNLITVKMHAEGERKELTLTNSEGELVNRYTYSSQNGEITETIHTDQLPAGVYMLTYTSGDRMQVTKISIIH